MVARYWKYVIFGRRMTSSMVVISMAMDTSASDLSIDIATKVVGRLWRDGVLKTETLDDVWRRDWTV